LEADPVASLKQLAADIERGVVATLIILGGNPAYDAPSDVKFGDKLRAVSTAIHVSSHFNETSEACVWHAPRAHELECWGDQRALDGIVAIQTPTIATLYGGRADIEVLSRLAGEPNPKSYDLVRETVRGS